MRLEKADVAAPALGISKSTLLAHAAAGKVPHYRLGHAVRFDVDELLSWARRERDGPPNKAEAARAGGLAVDREVP